MAKIDLHATTENVWAKANKIKELSAHLYKKGADEGQLLNHDLENYIEFKVMEAINPIQFSVENSLELKRGWIIRFVPGDSSDERLAYMQELDNQIEVAIAETLGRGR